MDNISGLQREDFDLNQTYYAYAEKVEYSVERDETYCFFELVSLQDFNDILSRIDNDYYSVLELPDVSLGFEFNSNTKPRLDRWLGEHQLQEERWYKITISNLSSDFHSANLSDSQLEEESMSVGLVNISGLYRNTKEVKEIERIFSLPENVRTAGVNDFVPETISDVFNERLIPAVLKCFNVGQGNCVSLLNNSGEPLLYFDFGGGFGRNKHTYPNDIYFCFSFLKPTVVLSHWDTDHWESVNYFEEALNMKWIVPKQHPLGISHLKLAEKLRRKGNLKYWPEGISSIGTPLGDFYKLPKGSNRNNSGIIMYAKIFPECKEGVPPKVILLPGDATYKKIPATKSYNLDALIVSHHGGDTGRKDKVPMAQEEHLAIYSYGKNNSYKHPDKKSINKHYSSGWFESEATINGHVFYPKSTESERKHRLYEKLDKMVT
jgi:hypothetical protein